MLDSDYENAYNQLPTGLPANVTNTYENLFNSGNIGMVVREEGENPMTNPRQFWPYVLPINATLPDPVQVILSTSTGTSLEIRDATYFDGSGYPNDFRTIDPGNYEVYLNQQGFYSLRAPQLYATLDAIYTFTSWSGNNVDFGGGATSTTNRETPVVFLSGDSVTANYIQVNNQPGTYLVPTNDKLTIPSDANITLKSTQNYDNSAFVPYYDDSEGFRLFIDGELVIEDGAVLQSDGQGLWGGIDVGDDGEVTLDKVTIKESYISINFNGPGDIDLESEIRNCIFESNFVSVRYLDDYVPLCPYGHQNVKVENCTFVNNTYSAYLEATLSFDECIDPGADGYLEISLKNNIIVNSDLDWLMAVNMTYNWVYECYVYPSWDIDPSNFVEVGPPLFVDQEDDNYHLNPNSPCIDAGDPDLDGDGSTWETDTDDQDPDGTRMDIGAYYFDFVPDPPLNLVSNLDNTCSQCHGGGIRLDWDENQEPDLSYYIVYRSESTEDCSQCHGEESDSKTEDMGEPENTTTCVKWSC